MGRWGTPRVTTCIVTPCSSPTFKGSQKVGGSCWNSGRDLPPPCSWWIWVRFFFQLFSCSFFPFFFRGFGRAKCDDQIFLWILPENMMKTWTDHGKSFPIIFDWSFEYMFPTALKTLWPVAGWRNFILHMASWIRVPTAVSSLPVAMQASGNKHSNC